MKKNICFITGNRAEYGLLKPLILAMKKDSNFNIQILVTAAHLSNEFGLTYQEIEQDGLVINEKVECLLSSDTPAAILKAMALAQIGFADALVRLSPDLVVILGDRFEMLSAASSALVLGIPIAHIHGGEITEAAFDDSIRHAITKMSHLHFTSTEVYRNRVIQLGEDPERVFNVGALGIDNIKSLKLLTKEQIEEELEFKFKEKILLVTFHPVTLEKHSSVKYFQDLLSVLDGLKDTAIIFTKANADPDGRKINHLIDLYVGKNSSKAKAFTSLGNLRYLSTMQYVDAVVGNSSSGIIEAPSFKIGTINIGDRQTGRVKAESIIDCQPEAKSIQSAFEKLYSREFQQKLKSVENLYGEGNTAKKMLAILNTFDYNLLGKKQFYNMGDKK
ncbi:MAG: UDP-N-acetylglucosamine 2-epimerase [Candidatus Margulisiibacteriota bacterium]|jgi:GDP/UDP-N,N'-diacetylbacillosamine 2-epimerase (hydrolysing)